MIALWEQMPVWLDYLLRGVFIAVLMACTAVVLGRAGRNPYWACLAIVPVPWLFVILVWVFAFCKWPNVPRDQARS